MIKGSRVELYELHVLYRSFGSVYHCFAIAGCYYRVCGGLVYRSAATGTHQCHLAQIGVHLLCVRVQHVGTITLDVWCATCHYYTQMVLCDYLNGKVVFLDVYIRVAAHRLHQSALYFRTGIVGMVKNSELGVSSLSVKVKGAVLLLVEVDAPFHEFVNLFRSVSNHLLHSLAVVDVVAGNYCVLDVFVEVVYFEVRYRSHSALCKIGVSLVEGCLADKTNLTLVFAGYFQRIAHSCYASADNQKVVFINHKDACKINDAKVIRFSESW